MTSNRQKVLIVDDVTKNIQVVANFLQQAGYEINFAVSGDSALKHIKQDKFDLILLDIMMPEMDGFEVCQKLKDSDETKDIPVIFLTAKTDIESIKKAFNAGGVDYITKPFNKAELLARVKTHLELQQQRKDLRELNATKEKFFSIIAHDLKSPLNQLLGLSDILIKELEKGNIDEIRSLASIINDSAKSGRTLLENLLDWSRSQTGVINYQPEKLDLKSLTDEILYHLEKNAEAKKVILKNNINDEIYAYADPNMIKTILRNLISNGIKFTPKGGVIKINAVKSENEIVCSVSDNGIGIQNDDIEKLFRIDINPNTIGNSMEKGTGLGLILCEEFVAINRGKIWVESKWKAGSTFYFSLPVK